MSGRTEMLARIRSSLADVSDTPAAEVDRGYRRAGSRDAESTIELLLERVREYGGSVRTCAADELADEIRASAGRRGVEGLAIPNGLPKSLRPARVDLVEADGLSPRDLDRIGAALTGCELAIAETGTLVIVPGKLGGTRALSLVPDVHLCVVHPRQIVETVPEAFERLAGAARAGLAFTFVSGPSATSDIELARVEGVHGPRQLEVFVSPYQEEDR